MGRTKQRSLLPVLLILLITITNIEAAEPSAEISIPNADEIFLELNAARTSPKAYAQYLENLRQYNGNKFKRPGRVTIKTKEGVAAIEEAITFLNSVTPVAPLTLSRGLTRAASDHVMEQSRTGGTGHGGDGSWVGERADRYGKWSGKIGENIAYGDSTARDVVISLIVDDGVPERGHRDNTFEPDYRMVGIACGSHPQWQATCVINFVAEYAER